VKKTLRISITV